MAVNFKMVSDGRRTCIEVDGKTMFRGVNSVEFSHDAIGVHTKIDLDLRDFRFEKDGYFDEVSRKLQAIPNQKPPAEEVTLDGLPLQ